MAKSTYYYEISKVDAVAERNIELLMQIKDIFKTNKGKYDVQRTYEEIDKITSSITKEFNGLCMKPDSSENALIRSITLIKGTAMITVFWSHSLGA